MRVIFVAGAAGFVLLLMSSVLGPYALIILCHMLVFSIACLGLNLLYGTAGSLSLGHATYFGVAAYVGAFLHRFYFVDTFELYLLTGVVFSTALAAVVGFLCVRTTKIFFTILTLACCMVVYSLFINGAVFRLFGGLGWALYLLGEGSMYIPRFPILGNQYSPQDFVPALYKVIVVAFVVSVLVLWRISSSPFGQALKAIRDNEARAAFIGLPVSEYRWYAFILSGLFVSLAGSLYGQLARQITPEQLHWLFSAQLIVAIVLGGRQQFLGPMLGASVFVWLEEISSRWPVGRYAMFGILLIIVVYWFPRGIAGVFDALLDKMRKYQSQ